MGEIPGSEVAKVTPEPSSWLSLRVFYLRLSKCELNESMVDSLTVIITSLNPDTVLEVNGDRAASTQSTQSNGHHVSCSLHRDRVDKASQEATFVSTETVRVTGSVRFQVKSSKGEKLLVGIMEMCDVVDGSGGEAKKGWVMKCQVAMQRGPGFLAEGAETQSSPPTIEVYVACFFQDAPIVFTKAMQLRLRRKRQVKSFMEPIPECGEQAEDAKETPLPKRDPEESGYRCYKPPPGADDDGFYCMRSAGPEGEGSELSWFTGGVRVGVGISLGICLGVGIGASLLARSYQSVTSRSLKRRLISNLL